MRPEQLHASAEDHVDLRTVEQHGHEVRDDFERSSKVGVPVACVVSAQLEGVVHAPANRLGFALIDIRTYDGDAIRSELPQALKDFGRGVFAAVIGEDQAVVRVLKKVPERVNRQTKSLIVARHDDHDGGFGQSAMIAYSSPLVRVLVVDGVMIVDKPQGLTSHDVVNRVRRLAGTRKVGHLGTLDPIATGVLPLVMGRATRLAQFFSSGEKEYDARIRFGWATDTYDRAGTAVSEPVEPSITREQLEEELAKFRGPIVQTPPPYSAKKVAGTPAYRLARKQIAVELAPVAVCIHALELVEFDGVRARIRVRCSTGTYLRSIAHDLGQHLECGAFLEELRRTASGEFSEKDARTFEQLEALASEGRLSEALIPATQVLSEFPTANVDALTAGQIRQGRDFRVSPFRARPEAKYVKAISPEGELIAIGEARLPHLYHPILVL